MRGREDARTRGREEALERHETRDTRHVVTTLVVMAAFEGAVARPSGAWRGWAGFTQRQPWLAGGGSARHPCIGTLERANVLTCQCANVPTCQRANVPTCQRANADAFTFLR